MDVDVGVGVDAADVGADAKSDSIQVAVPQQLRPGCTLDESDAGALADVNAGADSRMPHCAIGWGWEVEAPTRSWQTHWFQPDSPKTQHCSCAATKLVIPWKHCAGYGCGCECSHWNWLLRPPQLRWHYSSTAEDWWRC